ncbi:TetR/AcrR family transcriptional regulator [Patulibacter brassicae]|uniref:TetR/AcrR family transcriptional regulator n=1 Tax=Patulibacter brassicae TaxID=1705717 RepID=A0ABU4VKM6_9ACTN|nr:TetR/AcrR family transcriptional regulator [Patulibacter brassicae]MDX8152380.1 TetR/AcrR family transcriptional regulator [Patulibacter brassicae]
MRAQRAAVTPKGADRRERILRALEELLETTPFAEIKIGQLTARAEVTRPGFYFYFPTKSAAVAALLEDLFEATHQVAASWYGGDHPDPASAIAAVREGMAGTARLWRENARIFRAMIEAAHADPEVGVLWDAWRMAFVERVAARIVLEREAGEMLPGPRAELVAETLVGGVFFAMERDVAAVLAGTEGSLDELVDALVFVYANALYGEVRG